MNFEESAIDIILPVLESSIIYSSHYCKTCGRSTVTVLDLEYGLKYAAMTSVGKYIGTLFPEDSEEEDEDWASIVEDEDENEEFTRYEGTEDETCINMNSAYDSWDSWEPSSPAEYAIKNAIEKTKNGRIHTQ
jgi:hypothetical protein